MNYSVLYFSPTGGTAAVAEQIAGQMGCPAEDLTVSCPDKTYTPEDLVFVCFPVYGGRVPSPMLERVMHLTGQQTPFVPVAVFGNRAVDDALLELQDLMRLHGFTAVAGAEMIAPHSIDTRFGKGRPDEKDLRQLHDFLAAIRRTEPKEEIRMPGNPDYVAYGGLPFKPKAGLSCIRCGACAANCPAGAIPLSAPNRTEKSRCITCLRCVSVCPVGARKLAKSEQLLASVVLKKFCSERQEPRFYI